MPETESLISLSKYKFQKSIKASCVLKNGNLVMLLEDSANDSSITLRLVNKNTKEITDSKIKLTYDFAQCHALFSLGDFFLVAGKQNAYLFNSKLILESVIKAALGLGSVMEWSDNQFIYAYNHTIYLCNFSNPKNPSVSKINADPLISSEVIFLKLSNSLFIVNAYASDCDAFDFFIFSLDKFLCKVTPHYEDSSEDIEINRRIMGVLPNQQIVEVDVSNISDAGLFHSSCDEIDIIIRTPKTALSTENEIKLDKEILKWNIPGIHLENILEKTFPGCPSLVIENLTNRIVFIEYCLLFLKIDEIAVYDLQNRVQYNISLNFRAEGMAVQNDQLFIYNQNELQSYKFISLSQRMKNYITPEIVDSAPWCPINLVSLVADYVGIDVKLSHHHASIFYLRKSVKEVEKPASKLSLDDILTKSLPF